MSPLVEKLKVILNLGFCPNIEFLKLIRCEVTGDFTHSTNLKERMFMSKNG